VKARRPRLVAAGPWLVLLLGLASATLADDPRRRAAPLEPADSAVTGARPVFAVLYEGLSGPELRRARFRIVLSADGFRSSAYTFDQRARASGWVPGEPGRVHFRPRVPLADGAYEWRAGLWNGHAWIDGGETFRLRVDTVPPAPVEDLTLERSTEGSVRLAWPPVVLDRAGSPEYVARYVVYRFEGRGPFRLARAFAAGSPLEPVWTDETPTGSPGLVLYQVSAVDEAGNTVSGR